MIYRLAQILARALWHLLGRVEVRGLENVPADGPFLLIANHLSILDPILVQAILPRPLHTMAKSTQFTAPVVGELMARHLHSFPVRRYEIDPQAVRLVLRRLAEGQGVGIFIEGERSWDGRLQPPRLGTLRVILKAGVPVIPCGVHGTYGVWPRWGRLRRWPVRVTFGRPLRFPKLDHREQRDAALDETRRRLMGAIEACIVGNDSPPGAFDGAAMPG